jgi:hypothetical protein
MPVQGLPQHQPYNPVYPSHNYSGSFDQPYLPQAYHVTNTETTPLVPPVHTAAIQQPPKLVVKQTRSCCFGIVIALLFIFLVATAALVVGSISLTLYTSKRDPFAENSLVVTLPSNNYVNPFVVSYHPLANTTSTGLTTVTAGYGHSINEDKLMQSHDAWKPFVINDATKTAPYQDSIIVARVNPIGLNTILINSITKGSSRAGYDNVYTPTLSKLSKVLDLVRVNQEDTYRSDYILLYLGVDNYVYAVSFQMQSNDVIYSTNEVKIGQGSYGSITLLPKYQSFVTVAITTKSTYSHAMFLCNKDTGTKFQCQSVSLPFTTCSEQPTVLLYPTIQSSLYTTVRMSLMCNNIFTTFEYVNIGFGTFTVTSSLYLKNPFSNPGNVVQVNDKFIGYYTDSVGKLHACVVRAYNNYFGELVLTTCTYHQIAKDLIKPLTVQVAVAGSQIFFGYNTTKGSYNIQVVGVVAGLSSYAFTFAEVIDTSKISDSINVPLIVNINNKTVTLLYPPNPGYSTTTRVVTYDVRGGLTPVGITQAEYGQVIVPVHKIGVFYSYRGPFIAGAKYYAEQSGILTTWDLSKML